MKNFTATLVFLCFCALGYSQSDTLYTRKQEKIPCKIIEINEFDIKYKRPENIDGPLYVINKTTVVKYTLSNGFTELLLPDELSIENEHQEILQKRSVIKIHPFSFVNNQISLAYERVIKVGMNLDIEAGYSNSGINDHGLFGTISNEAFNTGFYIKPGVKFFVGQDYSVRGLKYAHPLKGRYIRLDLAFSYLNYQNILFGYKNSSPLYTNMNTVAFGGFVNYGRQFILGNLFTLDYYIGIGFTGQAQAFSNPAHTSSSYYDGSNVSNYHGFLRTPGVGLSYTLGFRLGYILPQKKTVQKKPGTSLH